MGIWEIKQIKYMWNIIEMSIATVHVWRTRCEMLKAETSFLHVFSKFRFTGELRENDPHRSYRVRVSV